MDSNLIAFPSEAAYRATTTEPSHSSSSCFWKKIFLLNQVKFRFKHSSSSSPLSSTQRRLRRFRRRRRRWVVWPDLAKFRHFGITLQVVGKFLTLYFLFGKMSSLFWLIWSIIGLILIVAHGPKLKNNLTPFGHTESLSFPWRVFIRKRRSWERPEHEFCLFRATAERGHDEGLPLLLLLETVL